MWNLVSMSVQAEAPSSFPDGHCPQERRWWHHQSLCCHLLQEPYDMAKIGPVSFSLQQHDSHVEHSCTRMNLMTHDFSVGTLSIWKFSLCTSLTLFISWLKTLHVLSGDLLNYQILSWLISMFCQLYVRYLCHITEECNNNIYNTSKHTFLCKLFKCLSRHHVLLTLDSAHSEYHGSATRKTLRDMANHDNYQAQIIRYHKTMKNITNKYKICIPYVHLHAAAHCQLYKFT